MSQKKGQIYMGSQRKTIPSFEVKTPSWRYLEVVEFLSAENYSKRKALPKHFSLGQEALVEVFRGPEESKHPEYRVALLMDRVPASRAILRGLLFSSAPISTISDIAGESSDAIYAYKELFFDTEVFRNTLLKIAYIRSLPQDSEADKFEKQMLSWGHYLGADYIAWKIGVERGTESPVDAVQGVLQDSMWRSREHRLSPLSSQEAKESRAWAPAVLKSVEMVRSIENSSGMENALSELKIKLEGNDETLTADELDGEVKG